MLGQLRGWEWLILLLITLMVSWLFALIPITIAYVRKTTNRLAVLLVALLAGWTCVGWIVALILAIVGKPAPEAAAGEMTPPPPPPGP